MVYTRRCTQGGIPGRVYKAGIPGRVYKAGIPGGVYTRRCYWDGCIPGGVTGTGVYLGVYGGWSIPRGVRRVGYTRVGITRVGITWV